MPNAATDERAGGAAPAPPSASGSRRRWLLGAWPWWTGALAGLLVLGPGLAPGSLYSLDLSLTPRIPLPPGFWGLGPALPQRVPTFLPIAALSPLVGGPAAGKLFLVACIAIAFAGAVRLAVSLPPLTRLGAGVLYAIGPFAVTRVAAGHLNVVLVAAALPWALPHLLRPSADLRRTFLAAVAMAVGGSASSSLVGVLLVIGLLTEDVRRRVGRVLLVVAAAALLWIIPDLVVLWAGAEVRGGDTFRTHLPDVWSAGGLLAGGGFWRADFQVGALGVGGALGGVVLTALAAYGHRELPGRWR
ncbi:MAG: hypothetical protein JWN46_3219, partial [Acidimicrobiales bacterium]|nr:hypothetical protein [Acidimicrobiales bacterium]